MKKRNTVTKHTDSLIQIKIPLPFPLRWVNSYMLRGQRGWTLIDPGIRTEETEQCWTEVLSQLGLKAANIEQIVLTHHHPDHYGLAGWIQQKSGAPVWMTESGRRQALELWGDGEHMTTAQLQLFRKHGMDEETLDAMNVHMQSFIPQVSPHPEVQTFALRSPDGDLQPYMPIQLGDRCFEVFHTPGHAMGHVCFYDRERKDLFCGDHVLPQITPNISLLPGVDPNPLDSFIRSLQAMKALEVEVAYPGHRDPFTGCSRRIDEILLHHEERLARIQQLAEEPATAYQLCRKLFGTRLSTHQLRFALSETISHLEYLRGRSRLIQSEGVNRTVFYQAARS